MLKKAVQTPRPFKLHDSVQACYLFVSISGRLSTKWSDKQRSNWIAGHFRPMTQTLLLQAKRMRGATQADRFFRCLVTASQLFSRVSPPGNLVSDDVLLLLTHLMSCISPVWCKGTQTSWEMVLITVFIMVVGSCWGALGEYRGRLLKFAPN